MLGGTDIDSFLAAVPAEKQLGAAILGLAEGQEIEWPQPDGHLMKVKIEKVLYQPERAGDYL